VRHILGALHLLPSDTVALVDLVALAPGLSGVCDDFGLDFVEGGTGVAQHVDLGARAEYSTIQCPVQYSVQYSTQYTLVQHPSYSTVSSTVPSTL
jgi:hypothetical protein